MPINSKKLIDLISMMLNFPEPATLPFSTPTIYGVDNIGVGLRNSRAKCEGWGGGDGEIGLQLSYV